MPDGVPKVGDIVNPSDTITARQDSIIKGLGTVSNITTGIMITGTVLDIVGNVMDNRESKKMEKQQEKNVKKKEQNALKKRRKRYNRGRHPLSHTGVVQEMFNQSTGHTRYGASQLPGRR